jgi:hypothetical protein
MNKKNKIWETEEILQAKSFFKKIANILNTFAHEHNLMIRKYYHDGPTWDFVFKHPEGGHCYIQVMKKDIQDSVYLTANWSLYEYDEGIGYNKRTEPIKCEIQREKLKEGLLIMLKQILNWKRKDLLFISKRGPGNKEIVTKEEFERSLSSYPLPKL